MKGRVGVHVHVEFYSTRAHENRGAMRGGHGTVKYELCESPHRAVRVSGTRPRPEHGENASVLGCCYTKTETNLTLGEGRYIRHTGHTAHG